MSTSPHIDLSESQMTIPSDSENYDANHDMSESDPPSSSSSPMILYSPPTFWSLMRGAAINLLLPFVNGLMLGFGELFANEFAFRLGWGGTKVGNDPLKVDHSLTSRRYSRHIGQGHEGLGPASR
ncbi:hypothetical protein CAC42_234 [Sphaceloma murrayae]|uniref:Mitochondrial import protein 1 n=1 Tax=Sphaceloma murrayae TaxID=2082308 RepID=A0A2K1QNQ7_9PEZI|nr:hypothetical protein CAC42_234 [Sphaceloma murrayae]